MGVIYMEKLNPGKVALVVSAFLGGWHLLWSVFVAMGYAQLVLDWVYWVHFLNNPFVLDIFDPTRAVMLIVFTSVVGYVGGWLFAVVGKGMLVALIPGDVVGRVEVHQCMRRNV